MTIQSELVAMQDCAYQAFLRRLLPTVAPEKVIGVRTPLLRAMARRLSGTDAARLFLTQLPHAYFEENNLHAFLIERIGDFDQTIQALDAFLPYVDNWATCDQLRPAVFQKHRARLLAPVDRWLASAHPYTVRFGIGMLMRFFLDDAFLPVYPQKVAAVQSGEYYVNMMIAWYFATALAKQWDAVLPMLQGCALTPWVHNKTIQKALESDRIAPEKKAQLRLLRVDLAQGGADPQAQ